jgi:hypothetical protein
MERRRSLEITAPSSPPVRRTSRPTRAVDVRASRRTMMRIMQRKSVGMVAVFEQDPVAGNAGSRVLVFESPTFTTRVTDYPAEWQRMTDDELSQLRRAAS